MTVVMAKTHHDNVSWTLLNESSSFIIPVLDKTFRGSCIGRETRSRRASVTHLARSVAGLKAPISPLPAWSEMGCISDGLSELTTTPVVGFSARKKQYRQPCDLPLTLSDIQKTLEQNRTEQNRTEDYAVFQDYHQAQGVTESWVSLSHSWINTTQNNSVLLGLTDMLQITPGMDTDLLSTDERHTHESLSFTGHNGVMGVPITFLDKYSPDQFEIVGATESEGKGFSNGLWNISSGIAQPVVNGARRYKRLFIKRRGRT